MIGNSTVRIVFYVDQCGDVEKVLETSTEPCSECGTEKPKVLTLDQIEALGYEAGRAIGGYAHGCWYNGLVKGLLAGSTYIIEEAVRRRPEDVRRTLQAHDAAD